MGEGQYHVCLAAAARQGHAVALWALLHPRRSLLPSQEQENKLGPLGWGWGTCKQLCLPPDSTSPRRWSVPTLQVLLSSKNCEPSPFSPLHTGRWLSLGPQWTAVPILGGSPSRAWDSLLGNLIPVYGICLLPQHLGPFLKCSEAPLGIQHLDAVGKATA